MSFPASVPTAITLALVLACGTMLAGWVVQVVRKDATLVDVLWAANLAFLAILFAAICDGFAPRRALIAILVSFWGFRLALHLFVQRAIGKPEDGRYRELRARWGVHANRNFFVFFQAQALLDVVLAAPFLVIALNSTAHFAPIEAAGVVLWTVALAGESLADRQLARFKADPASRGKTCRRGLWRFSRHPNYFFEWLNWCAYALIALAAPFGWIGLASPLIILFLILKVTGIPPTEAQSLRSRGDDYRDYQRTTSAFFPWFPRGASPDRTTASTKGARRN